jgi:hypothetical protein
MAVSVNVNWERRICMFPTFFDKDGLMYSNTAFGDYPHLGPAVSPSSKGLQQAGDFMGWMLLSYKKPVKASSAAAENLPQNIADENVKTFWLAAANDDKQWIEIDLQQPSKVFAIQVNYHDYKSGMYGRVSNLAHRYTIEGSMDGQNWNTVVDKSNNYNDVPNDYVELYNPQQLRYIRYKNIHVPTPHLAISGLRVFGISTGKKPTAVKNIKVGRDAGRKDVMINWDAQTNSQGYNVYWGIAPDKLYNSWMVYGENSLLMKSLSTDQQYYFSVEAFNENGVGEKVKPVKAE